MSDLGAYVRDAVETLRLPTDTRVIDIQVMETATGEIDMHVEFSNGTRSWASWPTGLELTLEVQQAIESHCRMLFHAELARRRLLQ